MTRQIIFSLLISSLTSCSNPSSQISSGPELILSANREAPIGWVSFDAYSNQTFNYSLSRGTKFNGTYLLKGDTLFLSCEDTTIGIDTVIIREKSLEFFGKASPRFATISIDKISE